MSCTQRKDWAISRTLYELRCIGEILQIMGNTKLIDGHETLPWMHWLGEQADRVADELDEAMLETGKGAHAKRKPEPATNSW
jgi:hypothetical protein